MHITQSRRDFLAGLSAAGAVSTLNARALLADETPPETNTIRIRVEDVPPNVVNGVAEATTCIAPLYITENLLRAEGFTDIAARHDFRGVERYVAGRLGRGAGA